MFEHWLNTSQFFGYIAFVLGVTAFLQKNDTRFKSYLTAEFIAYVVHFTQLGNPTAAASSCIAAARSLASIYSRSVWLAGAFVAINFSLGFVLIEVWWNWLPVVAISVGTLSVFLFQGVFMRLGMLVGTSLWIANNILSGSIGGTALEIVIAIANMYTISKFRTGSGTA